MGSSARSSLALRGWCRVIVYPLLWGGPLPDEIAMLNMAHLNAMIWLLTRHWNSILTVFDRGGIHPPLIVQGIGGVTSGRTWAQAIHARRQFRLTGCRPSSFKTKHRASFTESRGSLKIPILRSDKTFTRNRPLPSHCPGSPPRWRMPTSISSIGVSPIV